MKRTIFQNRFVRVDFEQAGFSFDFYDTAGRKTAAGVVSAVSTESAGKTRIFSTRDYRTVSPPTIKVGRDKFGRSRRISFGFSDIGKPEMLVAFDFYDEYPWFTIQLSACNRSDEEIKIIGFYPFCILPEGGGELNLGNDPGRWTFYKNGWQGHTKGCNLCLLILALTRLCALEKFGSDRNARPAALPGLCPAQKTD